MRDLEPEPARDATRAAPEQRSYTGDALRRFRAMPGATAGAAVIAAIVLAALLAPVLAGHDPLAQNLNAAGVAPGWHHPFGTDKLGRDIFARIVYGARVSMTIGFVAVGVAIAAGTAIGVAAGFFRGWVDSCAMAAMDVMLAFPSIILAIAITTILGPSVVNLMLALGIVYVPQYARLARSSTLGVAQLEYIEAARALGVSNGRTIVRHVLPNIAAPLLVQATLGIATAELEAAGLSYLGLGARPPAPEWGAMLNDARDYWVSAPWALLFPGLAITTLVLGFNLLGDGLRDALDPVNRG